MSADASMSVKNAIPSYISTVLERLSGLCAKDTVVALYQTGVCYRPDTAGDDVNSTGTRLKQRTTVILPAADVQNLQRWQRNQKESKTAVVRAERPKNEQPSALST